MSFHTTKEPAFVATIQVAATDIRAFMPIPRVQAPAVVRLPPTLDIRSTMPGNDKL